MTPVLRPHAVCDVQEPICPKCGQVLVARPTQKRDGSVFTCMNRHDGKTCSQKSVALESHGMVMIIAIDRREFDALVAMDGSLKEGLRELGILVGRVA